MDSEFHVKYDPNKGYFRVLTLVLMEDGLGAMCGRIFRHEKN